MSNSIQLTNLIKQKAYELGYVLCGITDTSPFEEFLAALDKRIARYPESAHLYEKLRPNAYPKQQADWAQSVIVCISRYGKYRLPEGVEGHIGKYYLTDGRLTYSREYHALETFQAFLKDLGMRVAVPRVTARWAAVRAGIARFGKNNFLYTQYGSWVVSKSWLVDAVLEYDAPQSPNLCPEKCTRCIDACPTKALEAPFMMNCGRCITHLSCHLTTLMPQYLRESVGTWVYGCDVCQDVCPMNANKWESQEPFPQLDDIARHLTLESLFRMTQEEYEQIVHPRLWYMDKDALWIWRSHALQAMANSGDERYHALIHEACSDPHDRFPAVRRGDDGARRHGPGRGHRLLPSSLEAIS
jgi:epoxyqueuosine reductase